MATDLSSCVKYYRPSYPFLPRNNNNYITARKFPPSIEKTCEICNIKATSNKVYQRHLEGKKHKSRVEKQGKEYICSVCNISANGQKQLESHLNGWKHKLEVEKIENPEKFIRNDSGAGGVIICVIVICLFVNFLVIFKMFL